MAAAAAARAVRVSTKPWHRRRRHLTAEVARGGPAVVVREHGPPRVLRFETAHPSARAATHPAPGQIAIAVAAAGVNPADTYIRAGVYNHLPTLPWVPGLEAAGTVTTSASSRFAEGDRVMVSCVGAHGGLATTSGLYAARATIDAALATKIPDNVGLEEAAAVPVAFFTALRALTRLGRLARGETVLVHGASGGVGLAAVQLARMLGAGAVLGTASSAEGRRAVLDAGADACISHVDAVGLEAARAALARSRGPDVIVEMAAHRNLAADLRLVAPRGQRTAESARRLARGGMSLVSRAARSHCRPRRRRRGPRARRGESARRDGARGYRGRLLPLGAEHGRTGRSRGNHHHGIGLGRSRPRRWRAIRARRRRGRPRGGRSGHRRAGRARRPREGHPDDIARFEASPESLNQKSKPTRPAHFFF